MSTLQKNPNASRKEVGTLFRSNPVLTRISKDVEQTGSTTATYRGIAEKVSFFLAIALIGMLVYQLLNQAVFNKGEMIPLTYEGFSFSFSKTGGIVVVVLAIIGIISELIAVFSRRMVALFGSIYTFTEGFFIGFLIFTVLEPSGYSYLGLEALLLTAAVNCVMGWLFATGRIRVSQKFYTVVMTLAFGSIVVGLLLLIGSFIPGLKDVIGAMRNNFGLCIAVDVFGIVLASLFLISDYALIDECVKNNYPKEFEWYAAFGLSFTIIWLYLKILDLLIRLAGKDKNK